MACWSLLFSSDLEVLCVRSCQQCDQRDGNEQDAAHDGDGVWQRGIHSDTTRSASEATVDFRLQTRQFEIPAETEIHGETSLRRVEASEKLEDDAGHGETTTLNCLHSPWPYSPAPI